MIDVLLIDDHGLVRTGIRMLLEGTGDFNVVAEAADGEEGIRLARQLAPDLVICDLHLPGMSGLEVTERLVRAKAGQKVMIVTMQEEGPLPRRLLHAGALGYVAKACAHEEFLRAAREVAQGRRYLSAEIAQRLALEPPGAEQSPFDLLSPRELEVVKMLCQGKRGADIAETLHLSPKTVSTHKQRLLDKLGVEDVVTLSRLASQHGIVA
ncbi:response regulator [Pseudomarimonas salicorniae]|uniref:Response regulator n=1 Tax=Pseudomarimonas salicorniae TaxID=2933270 RepID=A0ABT0GK85_9GAMM|nr:response regulator [Lysobacter sp. CAU 1642]MCK7594949.1 response regulator [Lysobacter sp. CAU 1642]